jgi:hypothetical protein
LDSIDEAVKIMSNRKHNDKGQRPLPFPLDPETMQEFKMFFLFMILSDCQERGITGYQLNAKYKFPRTSANRLIEKLIKLNQVVASTTEELGKTQVLYKLTKTGKEQLEQLKETWGERFAEMAELAPLDRLADPFKRERDFEKLISHVQELKTNEDAEIFVKGFIQNVRRDVLRQENNLDILNRIIKELDKLLKAIVKQKTLSKEEITNLLRQIQKRIEGNRISKGKGA